MTSSVRITFPRRRPGAVKRPAPAAAGTPAAAPQRPFTPVDHAGVGGDAVGAQHYRNTLDPVDRLDRPRNG
ncbi:hypothetical protein [Nocardia lasii]|uniref:Uncharacterized protein n=1 Tax=Nocardia lasii TaxID=1616107 RepID=A0ABW1JUF4_9NOCA